MEPHPVRPHPLRSASRTLLACCVWVMMFGCDLFRFSEPGHAKNRHADTAGAAGEDDGVLQPSRVCGSSGKPCAPTEDGRGTTCFSASALGGEDFCAEACDPSIAVEDEGSVCVAAGARLARCHPNGHSDAADCPAGFNCYRTNLILDQGVCIKMPVCSQDSDCPGATHETCTSSLVADRAGLSTLLHLDHLNCVHRFCVALASGCVNGEGCLGKQYFADGADLCTPDCDTNLNCPPNYSCLRTTSGAGSPTLCLPGLPGFRCTGDSCVIGTCEDSGANFNICTISCSTDADCKVLNTSADTFYCVEAAGHRHCVTARPFHGANCFKTEQCNAEQGEICSQWGPTGVRTNRGECRTPCNADGSCDPRGGLPHTCLANGEGGCFPGEQGLPCQSSSECLSGLTCLDVPGEPELGIGAGRICTRPCSPDGSPDADAECDPPYTINNRGYCSAGHCRAKRSASQNCTRDAQCESGLCDRDSHVCVDETTPPLE